MFETRIHKILAEVGSIAFPGVYDALSAAIAEKNGFPMVFVSGYSVAGTRIGEPDFGLLTQTEITAAAQAICNNVNIPVIVDADTGYGNPLNVYRTVNDLINVGAAGCFLEDQQWPKKCGHMRGKKLIDRDEYVQKIRAAVDARDGRDFFIVARTDAEQVLGLDEAIVRVEAARAVGADASFIEAPSSVEQLSEVGRRAEGPLVANMIEGGKTPVLQQKELAEMGFQLILYPLCGLYAAAAAVDSIYAKLKADGTTLGTDQNLMNFTRFNELIGVDEKYAIAEKYGVK